MLVSTFNRAITSAGSVTTSVGSASAVSAGNDVVVTLTAVADNSRATISLINVNSSGLTFAASLGFLVGDVNNTTRAR